jgi:hypothetical protein
VSIEAQRQRRRADFSFPIHAVRPALMMRTGDLEATLVCCWDHFTADSTPGHCSPARKEWMVRSGLSLATAFHCSNRVWALLKFKRESTGSMINPKGIETGVTQNKSKANCFAC